MPWVYLVRCADDTLYTGWTTDLQRRLQTHNAGRGARYTRTRRPVTLVYQEQVPDRAAALRREAEIKTYTRSKKLALIREAASQTSEPRKEANDGEENLS